MIEGKAPNDSASDCAHRGGVWHSQKGCLVKKTDCGNDYWSGGWDECLSPLPPGFRAVASCPGAGDPWSVRTGWAPFTCEQRGGFPDPTDPKRCLITVPNVPQSACLEPDIWQNGNCTTLLTKIVMSAQAPCPGGALAVLGGIDKKWLVIGAVALGAAALWGAKKVFVANATEAPNLDDDEERDAYMQHHQGSRGLQMQYARLKEHATAERLAGNVTVALRLEKQADRIYSRMPARMKW